MINRIYGILSCGIVNEADEYGRFSDTYASPSTAKELSRLLSTDPTIRGMQIELLLWIMRSHYSWVKLIKDFDPDNSYDSLIDVNIDCDLSFRKIYDWAVDAPKIINEYTIGADINSTPLDLIVDRLIGVVTSNR